MTLRLLIFLVATAGLLGCPENKTVSLKPVNGGFDPTRYESGILPAFKPGEEKPERITLSMTPYYSSETHQAIIGPIAAYLQKELRLPVTIINVANYRELIDFVVADKVDVALISPLAFILAKEKKPNLNLLAAVVAQGTTTYSGYLVTPIDSPITDLTGAKGKHLALVDPVSTSGSLFPHLLFQKKRHYRGRFFCLRPVHRHARSRPEFNP